MSVCVFVCVCVAVCLSGCLFVCDLDLDLSVCAWSPYQLIDKCIFFFVSNNSEIHAPVLTQLSGLEEGVIDSDQLIPRSPVI